MGSNLQTGLLLIIGTIASFIGWWFVYPASGDASETKIAENAAALMADPTLGKIGMLMGFGGMGAVFIGFLNISRKMAAGDGKGASYANISAIMALILIVMGAMTVGIEWAVTETTSVADATNLMLHSVAGETTFTLACGLLLVLLGVGIVLERNFHIVIGGLAVLAGALFIIANVHETLGIGGFIGWIGLMLVALALGVQSLRLKG